MFKNMIAPVQAWLLSQGKCVGCSIPLADGKKKNRKDAMVQVSCRCGRTFIYNPGKKSYRRALMSEIE